MHAEWVLNGKISEVIGFTNHGAFSASASLKKGGHCTQSQLAFCHITPMAIDAMGLKNGPDLRLEMIRRDPFLSERGDCRKSRQHREAPNQMEICPRKVSRHFGFLVQRKKNYSGRDILLPGDGYGTGFSWPVPPVPLLGSRLLESLRFLHPDVCFLRRLP